MQSNLIIYNCSKCGIIISTNLHIVFELKDSEILIFHEAAAKKTKTLQTSLNSFDKFCTFQSLFCVSCSQPLGRYYKAMTPYLAKFCNHYFIAKEKLFKFERTDEFRKSEKSTPTFTNCMNDELKQADPAKVQIMMVEKDINLFDPLSNFELTDPYGISKF